MYTGVWGLAMLVGSPKGWKLRPPLGPLSLSWLFWLVVLVVKWSFEYFALVRSMVLPTLALWEADYSCWEPGHTGKVGCSWDVGQGRFANQDYRAVRDWGFRVALIALRWSTPLLIILADTMVVYMAVLSVASVLLAKWQRLGAPLAPPSPRTPHPAPRTVSPLRLTKPARALQAYVTRLFGSNSDGKLGMPPLLVFLQGFKVRLFNGVLTVLLIFILGIYSAAGDAIPLWLYALAIGIIAVGGVASAAMFVAQMAFFNRVSDPKIGGTYMTMLNTISNLGGQWPGTAIFATKAAIERVTDPQTGFYGVCACSVAVGLAWFYLMQDRLLAIQALPAKRWIASS